VGQTADGSILLLAIDGRMANSLGASFSDVQDIMLEYGAINASVMDGGTSTQMYYNGEVINTPYSPFGPRACPTAFLIK
jgi:exopolysaccharide biosynthesis protein